MHHSNKSHSSRVIQTTASENISLDWQDESRDPLISTGVAAGYNVNC